MAQNFLVPEPALDLAYYTDDISLKFRYIIVDSCKVLPVVLGVEYFLTVYSWKLIVCLWIFASIFVILQNSIAIQKWFVCLLQPDVSSNGLTFFRETSATS